MKWNEIEIEQGFTKTVQSDWRQLRRAMNPEKPKGFDRTMVKSKIRLFLTPTRTNYFGSDNENYEK